MAFLSASEIQSRAYDFLVKWQNYDGKEMAESQTFWNDFFFVFGVTRREVAAFEESVKKLSGHSGRIDLFWPGKLLVEQKDPTKELNEKVQEQAFDYFHQIKPEEKPQYIILCNFKTFVLIDLEEKDPSLRRKIIQLDELPQKINLFSFIVGEKSQFEELNEIDIKASRLMADLYESLAGKNPEYATLDIFSIRLLYCLFADSTQIFNQNAFRKYVLNTREDGMDVGPMLSLLFQKLDQPRGSGDINFKHFPYINGNLFGDRIDIPVFDSESRALLLKCCEFDWGQISPAIFGSLFQNISDPERRRALGEHYTSETNILKILNPLFLDNLKQELSKAPTQIQLKQFLSKLAKLKFLDPACGCGNFLVVAYRELRRLELEALKELYADSKARELDVNILSEVNVDQFYGIEIAEFPAKIAQVALWLTDHQMNLELSKAFGGYNPRIPLTHSAMIVTGNALRIDWNKVIPAKELNYIMGNPPFVGARLKSEEQKDDIEIIFNQKEGKNDLDYVACWYKKAAEIMQINPKIISAFVSSNSIVQGIQVTPLWTELLKAGVHIHFAHRTFSWDNEAGDKAAVHCVIIGFALFDIPDKKLWDYFDIKDTQGVCKQVSKINPYLLELDNALVKARKKPITERESMSFGNMPNDDGNFLFSPEEKERFLNEEPRAEKFFRPLLGANEFINNIPRYCLWLKDVLPSEFKHLPKIQERLKEIKEFRLKSTRSATQKLADTPYLFAEIRQPSTDYLLIPRVSSERRKYIPIGYINKKTIATDAVFTIENATPYLFGILTSIMHMTWIKYVCGRLESRYRYSNTLGYNTFPFPLSPSQAKQDKVSAAAQQVLDIRKIYLDKGQSYADLYDPDLMPIDLLKSHKNLDKAVDQCYGFKTKEIGGDSERIAFLFQLYLKQAENLLQDGDT